MPKFRKKQIGVVVEAVQFNGTDRAVIEIMKLLNDNVRAIRQDGNSLVVPCGLNKRRAERTNWIIKEENGDLEICTNDVFERVFEKV